MKTHMLEPDDQRLRSLLRESLPAPQLPPGFRQGVWRRIETAETRQGTALPNWFDGALAWLLRPRLAIAVVVAMIAIGGSIGVRDGVSISKQTAQERYLASVSPLTELQ